MNTQIKIKCVGVGLSVTHRTLVMLLLMMLVGTITLHSQSNNPDDYNLLRNSGFESDLYTPVSSDPESDAVYNVPLFWHGGVVLTPRNKPWQNIHPTGYPHTADFVRSGDRSFHMARGGGTFTAYLYQQVNVPAETRLTAEAWTYIENQSGFTRIGIDPQGGDNPFSPSIVWSGWSTIVNQWNRLSTAATTQGETATLFLYATQTAPNDPNGVYWDDAVLEGRLLDANSTEVTVQQSITLPDDVENNPILEVTSEQTIYNEPGTSPAGEVEPFVPYVVMDAIEGWYVIEVDGQTVYVNSEDATVYYGEDQIPRPNQPATLLTPRQVQVITPVPNASHTFTATVTKNILAAPDGESEVIGQLPFRDYAAIVGRTADDTWLQVNYRGVLGWVSNRFGRVTGDLSEVEIVE